MSAYKDSPLIHIFAFFIIYILGANTGPMAMQLIKEIDIKGPTVEHRLGGITKYENNISGKHDRVYGIDPKTKLEFYRKFYSFDVYHDLKNGEAPYITWKENNLTEWDAKLHIKDEK